MQSKGVRMTGGPGWSVRMARLRAARGAWVAVMVLLGIHGLVVASGGVQWMADWYLSFGLRRSDVLAGRVWQVLTYAALHGNWLHAGLNALGVLLLGARVEDVLGRRGFWLVLVAGVLGGALGHLLLSDAGAGAFPLVGISGGVVALLLAVTTLSPGSRMMPLPVSGRSLGRGILLASGLLVLVNPKLGLPGLSAVGDALVACGLGSWFLIGHACHLGGGVAGWLCGRWILRPRVTLAELRRERERAERDQSNGGL